MADSICNTTPPGMFSETAKLKYKTTCAMPPELQDKKNIPPIFSPEGMEGAQQYVDKNYPQCKAVENPELNSVFSLYNVECP